MAEKKNFTGALKTVKSRAAEMLEANTGERITPEQYSERITAETKNKGIRPGNKDFRTSRAELLLTPSLHSKLKEEARLNNISFNELVNQILQNHIEGGE